MTCEHKHGFVKVAEYGRLENASVTVVCVEGCGQIRTVHISGQVNIYDKAN